MLLFWQFSLWFFHLLNFFNWFINSGSTRVGEKVKPVHVNKLDVFSTVHRFSCINPYHTFFDFFKPLLLYFPLTSAYLSFYLSNFVRKVAPIHGSWWNLISDGVGNCRCRRHEVILLLLPNPTFLRLYLNELLFLNSKDCLFRGSELCVTLHSDSYLRKFVRHSRLAVTTWWGHLLTCSKLVHLQWLPRVFDWRQHPDVIIIDKYWVTVKILEEQSADGRKRRCKWPPMNLVGTMRHKARRLLESTVNK